MVQNSYIIIVLAIFPTLAILAFITSLVNYTQNSRARLYNARTLQALGEEHAIMLLTMQGLVALAEGDRRDINQLRNITRMAAGRRVDQRNGRSDSEDGDHVQHLPRTDAATHRTRGTTRPTRTRRRDSLIAPSEHPYRLRTARANRDTTATPLTNNDPHTNNFNTPTSPLLVTDALLSRFSHNSSTLTERSSTSSSSTDPPSIIMRTATSPTPSELSGDTLVGSDSYHFLDRNHAMFAVRGRPLTTAEERLLRGLEVEVREWEEGWPSWSGRGDEDDENEAGRENEQSVMETYIDGGAGEP
jgi:hypothetical protein